MENKPEKSSLSAQDKFKIWWDEEHGIIRYKEFVDVDMDQALAQKICDEIDRLLADHPRASILVDVTPQKTIPPSSARKILSNLTGRFAASKIAILNAQTALRVTFNFVLAASGHKNSRSFATEAVALAWLRQD